MSKKFITTGAFPEPEWTQVPNKFFDMLPEMEASEALTTLVLIRETYGYHRDSCKMSIAKLAEAAGISEGSVKNGAEAAEKRGTFRRSNPDEKTSAEWELITGTTIEGVNGCGGEGQPLTHPGTTIDPQLGVKESIKKDKDLIDSLLEMSNFSGAKREARIASIQSYFGERFRINAESKKWRDFARYVDDRQQNFGEDVKVFVSWLYGQKGFDLAYWPPSKMQEFWPSAFVKEENKSSMFETLS